MVSLCYWYVFFFFKQKTAYEMRISDWSSDVCSSDLITEAEVAAARAYRSVQRPKVAASPGTRLGESRAWVVLLRKLRFLRKTVCAQAGMPCWHRSEEHTSELQSLMRNSYAVFCLKKKK